MTTTQLHTSDLHRRALFAGMIDAPRNLARQIARRRKFRSAFIPLLTERDQILCDIGYQRHDILRALRLPLREDAIGYIECKRLTRPTEADQTRLTR
ncbi:hypothetical protein [Marinobacter sp.]|uniref:hypothetical protein n=1 Tax=Marinobacter sp. TaxID=50741 RepID=UPI002B4A4F7B|nr:hypothetical protein [Marinobacter sp.]HKK57305.1 hypothetical protein [Marinobacter sp.]